MDWPSEPPTRLPQSRYASNVRTRGAATPRRAGNQIRRIGRRAWGGKTGPKVNMYVCCRKVIVSMIVVWNSMVMIIGWMTEQGEGIIMKCPFTHNPTAQREDRHAGRLFKLSYITLSPASHVQTARHLLYPAPPGRVSASGESESDPPAPALAPAAGGTCVTLCPAVSVYCSVPVGCLCTCRRRTCGRVCRVGN